MWYVIISAGLSLSLSLCVVCIVFLKFTASSDLMVTYVIHKLCVTVIIVYALLTPHTRTLSLNHPFVLVHHTCLNGREGGREGREGGREGREGGREGRDVHSCTGRSDVLMDSYPVSCSCILFKL